MPLSAVQLKRMSQLLDEALPLDERARRRWLETIAAKEPDLLRALRRALLPAAIEASSLDELFILPKFEAEEGAGAVRMPRNGWVLIS